MRQPCDYSYDDSDPFGNVGPYRSYPHTGSDWFAPAGSPAYAIAGPSLVVATGWHDGNGNYVAIQLPDGSFWSYIHLSEIRVSVGQTVNEGEIVALTGCTGTNCHGAHLHCSHSDDPRVYVGLGNLADPWGYLGGATGGSDSSTLWDQQRLNVWAAADGIGTITEDGERGPQTISRIRDFQSKHGLDVDGNAGPLTDAVLGTDPGGAPAPTGHPYPGLTQWGTSGQGITIQYQRRLAELGYDVGPLDDDQGTKTTAALYAFQHDRGLAEDGQGGPQTWAALWTDQSAAPTPAPTPVPVVPADSSLTTTAVEPPTVVVSQPRHSARTKRAEPVVMPDTSGLPSADLGVIIRSSAVRRVVYAIYALASLAMSNTAIGLFTAGIPTPLWLKVTLAVFGNLATPFAALAIANAKPKPKARS